MKNDWTWALPSSTTELSLSNSKVKQTKFNLLNDVLISLHNIILDNNMFHICEI